MTLVMGWVARSRNRARPVAEARLLRHPPSTLIIGMAGFIFFFGVAVVSNVFPNKTATLLTTSVFVGFSLLSTVAIADYFLARHELLDGGMSYGRLLGSRGSLKWNEVCRIRYAPVMKWFEIELASGEVARVSAMLTGLPAFARAVLLHVPPGTIDAETLAVLQATADGNPPKVWG
jgi:hypothetical protein